MVKIAGDEVCPRHSDSRALWVTDGGKRIRLEDNAYVNQKVEVESESRLSHLRPSFGLQPGAQVLLTKLMKSDVCLFWMKMLNAPNMHINVTLIWTFSHPLYVQLFKCFSSSLSDKVLNCSECMNPPVNVTVQWQSCYWHGCSHFHISWPRQHWTKRSHDWCFFRSYIEIQ